jgi:release factor glutamine methyltransferase
LSTLAGIYGEQEAAQMTTMIFESQAGITRAAFVKDPEQVLAEDIYIKLQQALTDLEAHRPVQYITGEAWFYHLKLSVTDAVLIPRPETEELVHAAISFLKTKRNPTVIDIGTGSGAIPIAIKKNLPQAKLSAVDVSIPCLSSSRLRKKC